jgi:putative ABC transport system permease protein
MFRQFRSRPLQAILTILAVALGVAVVTAVAAFLDINRQSQKTFINSHEARMLTLQTLEDDYNAFAGDDALVREVGLMDDQGVTLAQEDVEQAKAASPSVDYAYVSSVVGVAMRGNIISVSKDFIDAHGITLLQGSPFTESDYTEQRSVAIVSRRAIELHNLPDNPIGQTIKDDDNFMALQIIGVMANDAIKDAYGETVDILIPFRVDSYNPMYAPSFVVKDIGNLNVARAELQAFASKTWGERVTVRSNNLETYTAQQRTTRFLIATLASVSLVSAALNIMNLMLAQVFKNRRETGILRSLGATRAIIRNQYLSNALILGSVGGVLGVALGYALLWAFNSYVATANPDALGLAPSLLALLIGFASALGISAVFALYPALLASRMNVVEALKES